MANFDSLKQTVAEAKVTLASAAKTIRALIERRNAALAAANPDDVRQAHADTIAATQAKDLQDGLESARLDTEAAIAEANAPVKATPPKPAAKPATAPKAGETTT